MRRTYTGTGLHRDHGFDAHRHIDDNTVALADAQRFEAVGELAYAADEALDRWN